VGEPVRRVLSVWRHVNRTATFATLSEESLIPTTKLVKNPVSSYQIFFLLLRVSLGVLFLITGLQKVSHPGNFAEVIANYGLLPKPLVHLSALFVPWLEILLGICFILGWLTRAASLLMAGLSLAFAFFVGSAVYRGLDVDCGCFAGASSVSWWHVALDLGLTMLSILFLTRGAVLLSLDTFLGKRQNSKEPSLSRPFVGSGLLLFFFNISVLLAVGLPRLESEPLPEPATGPAQLVFVNEILDFGVVKQEEPSVVTVLYKNIGTSEAVVSKVESTCGCTTAKLGKSRLLPGETASLEVTYNAGVNTGRFQQNVRLIVEGQDIPPVLTVRGTIDPVARALPGLLKMAPGDSKVVKIESRRKNFRPTVKGLSSSLKGLDMKTLESASDGSPRIELTLSASIPEPPGKATAWPVRIVLEAAPPCTVYLQPKKKAG